jgi:hypothetical protein
MRFCWKSEMRRAALSTFVSTLPPSTKVIRLKSTSVWRPKVHVVVLHSASTFRLRTASMRFWMVSLTHFTLTFERLSCEPMPSATARQRSIE